MLLPTDDRTPIPHVLISDYVVVTPVYDPCYLRLHHVGYSHMILEIEIHLSGSGKRVDGEALEPFDQRRGGTSTSCIVCWRCTVTCEPWSIAKSTDFGHVLHTSVGDLRRRVVIG